MWKKKDESQNKQEESEKKRREKEILKKEQKGRNLKGRGKRKEESEI